MLFQHFHHQRHHFAYNRGRWYILADAMGDIGRLSWEAKSTFRAVHTLLNYWEATLGGQAGEPNWEAKLGSNAGKHSKEGGKGERQSREGGKAGRES